MHTHAQTHIGSHRRTKTSKQQWEMLKATKQQRHTYTQQVLQHITGSAAHSGMDYHTVTLRVTPTDNKLQTATEGGGGGEVAKMRTECKSRRG